MPKSGDGPHAEEPMELLMEDPSPLQLVPRAALVRVLHDGVRDVRQRVAGEQDFAGPGEIFGNRDLRKGMLLPD
jgi:hypothetical protein